MTKSRSPRRKTQAPGLKLFDGVGSRRRRALILPRFLAAEADTFYFRTPQRDRAFVILTKWADMQAQGHLTKKETALDAGFLLEVFGEALGYKPVTHSPEHYALERNFTVPGVGTADGALGEFSTTAPPKPVAVIELKDAATDLDRDKFNGRTAVQQCWDYLYALPDCPWGIVSNFVTFRLYHRDKTPLVYQEYRLKDLREPEIFHQFYFLFEYSGLMTSPMREQARALRLLEKTDNRQREVGDELYQSYSDHRYRLIEELHVKRGKPLDKAIHIAQKILDRIIFVAFCEDRNLLPEKCIENTYKNIPPFARVTNPRWRNFVGLFQAIDEGHEDLKLEAGYNGGLFKKDPEVDDLELLDDSWPNFFQSIGRYDFRDEVHVDVLGHLFERSIGELERLRAGGLFGRSGVLAASSEARPAMPKSAERKRFGIYYTPPEFTHFIVKHAVDAVVSERFEEIQKKHKLRPEDLETDKPSKALAAYWQECWQALRDLKVCDPACGSGAFLIQAYDVLEERYHVVADNLAFHGAKGKDGYAESIPELILAENLFGVDLSEQAVEITQLALWIRSAQRSKKLADLSRNILWGNSLVADPAVHPRALRWADAFPTVFTRANAGFDCVIGNPPWERMKLQKREFFSRSAPDILEDANAAKVRESIAKLEKKDPDLFQRYQLALAAAERTLDHVRTCGAYPLTGKGDINSYSIFAELARKIVASTGRVGLLVPSGIATDHTTKDFFAALMESKSLIRFHDFENRLRIFPDVDGRFKFCVLLFGGQEVKSVKADFVFFAHHMEDLEDKHRHISLSSKDIALVNPNTRTCPIFRSVRDAEIAKKIYRTVPILIDHQREEGGNPWQITFKTPFHQSFDAHLFKSADEIKAEGFALVGNRWIKGKEIFLPLYEAKMAHPYDHRASNIIVASGNWTRKGQTEKTSLVEHQNPEYSAMPRWWTSMEAVRGLLLGEGGTLPSAVLTFRKVTSPTNERTLLAAFIPPCGLVDSLQLILFTPPVEPRLQACLLGNLNAYMLDYVVRQKIGNVNLNFFIVEQLPIFPPDHYAQRCPWNKRQTLEKWISDRVLKLTCTANDMRPLAEEAGFDPPVHKWNEAERGQLLAELDAAFFLLYGIDRDDMEYVLSTFQGLQSEGEPLPGMVPRTRGIVEAYEKLRNSQ